MIEVICRNSSNNLVPVKGERRSFQLRQRSRTQDGYKVNPLSFISFKAVEKIIDKKIMFPEVTLYTVARL